MHPREVDAHFAHGTVKNYWGGSSNATTHLLDAMHYSGLIGVVGREKGLRIYGPRTHGPGPADATERRARLDALVDVVVRIYAPMPAPTLSFSEAPRFAVPQWRPRPLPLNRAKKRPPRARVEGDRLVLVGGRRAPRGGEPDEAARFLAPFDPVVQDRERFERLWGWVYRFEAYTPASKRKLGYYALPLLWRDRVIGWGNLSVNGGSLEADVGYVKSRAPAERAFKRELEAELERVRAFLGHGDHG